MNPFCRSRVSLVVAALALSLSIVGITPGCSRRAPEETRSLPALNFKDDSPDLLLTWIDAKGDPHTATQAAEVPAEGRSFVRVVVSDREDGTKDLFYVSDLGLKQADGTYSTRTLSRRAWEGEIEKRREAYLAQTSPQSSSAGSTGSAASALTVIIYGASWCGPCHQAAEYLKSKGIRYVMKDVEETPGAQSEMREKLARAGRRGGSIPVLDVGGQIIVGFSPSAVDQAVAAASHATL